MFTCGVCHGNEGHGEFVEEVFNVDGRYVLVGSVPSGQVAANAAESAPSPSR